MNPFRLLLRWGCAGLLAPWLFPLGAAAEPLRVVTSILPVYCLTRTVVGEAAAVENLLSAGTDAHDFQLARRERNLFDTAALILVNGLGLEPWLENALKRAGPGRNVVEVAAGICPGSSGQAAVNPHLWLDPLLACGMVTNILQALLATDPSGRELYVRNANVVVSRLQRFHEEQRAQLAPFRGACLITHHDAFAHFARRYNLNIVGVIEEIPDVPPSPRHLSRLREIARQRSVKAIFLELQHAGKQARQLAADLKLPVASLDPLETGPLRAEAYEEGLRKNLLVLQQYLK